MRRHVNMLVDIDAEEFLSELSDKEIQEEAERRCIDMARRIQEASEDTMRPLIEEAYTYLQGGRAADAELTLQRALYPKWQSPESALAALKSRKSS